MSEEQVQDKPVVEEKAKDISVKITIDTPSDRMLEYDKEGVNLEFETSPGKFKQLSEKEIYALSMQNRLRYHSYYDESQYRLKQEGNPLKDAEVLVTLPGGGTATSRLTALNKQKGFHYHWNRPDELGVMHRMGADTVKKGEKNRDGKEIEVLSGVPTERGTFAVKDSAGNEELILFKTPQEKADLWQKLSEDKSKIKNGQVLNSTKKELENSGVTTFIPGDKNDGRNWS